MNKQIKRSRADRRKSRRVCSVDAGRVAKTAGTNPGAAVRVGGDVIDDVVRTRRIARNSAHSRQMVQLQVVSDPPRNVMVSAGRISAHPNGPYKFLAGPIKSQPTAEDIDAPDLVPHHRIACRSVA